jgi:hypothetical protein
MIAYMNANHMLQQALFLLITSVCCITSPADCRASHAAHLVTVKETQQGLLISADVLAEPCDNLLRDLGSQCDINITCRGRCRLAQPVNIHFHDLPLEQAIKKLIRAAGINNYLIRSSDADNGQQAMTEVVVFGNRTMAKAALNQAGTAADEKLHALSDDRKPPVAPADAYSKKIASFKDRYRWESEKTRDWAVHLLEAMPDEVKDFGLDHIIKQLDQVNEPEGTAAVNSELFYRAIEASAPPGLAPAMMRQVRRVSEQYRDRAAQGKADASCEGF